jgi:uncharacterized coiled-coil protein SlyX
MKTEQQLIDELSATVLKQQHQINTLQADLAYYRDDVRTKTALIQELLFLRHTMSAEVNQLSEENAQLEWVARIAAETAERLRNEREQWQRDA